MQNPVDIIRREISLAAIWPGHDIAAFGGENHFVASSPQGFAEQGFRIAGAVGVRRVDEIHAQFKRRIDGA